MQPEVKIGTALFIPQSDNIEISCTISVAFYKNNYKIVPVPKHHTMKTEE
jgi:hypothetical protein